VKQDCKNVTGKTDRKRLNTANPVMPVIPVTLSKDQKSDVKTLETWGVSPDDAEKIVQSQHSAMKSLAFRLWGCDGTLTKRDVERLVFFGIKASDDPLKTLGEMLRDSAMAPDWKKDVCGFLGRLHAYLKSKGPGRSPDALSCDLVLRWTIPTRMKNGALLPPLCLLSDTGIGLIHGFSETAVRQRIVRDLKLYRPTRPRYSAREVIKGGERFLSIAGRKKSVKWGKAGEA
jgi:hypothetical protein